jgi:hypothetical protein
MTRGLRTKVSGERTFGLRVWDLNYSVPVTLEMRRTDTMAIWNRSPHPRTTAAIRDAFEAAGVIFVENGEGQGVKLRKGAQR